MSGCFGLLGYGADSATLAGLRAGGGDWSALPIPGGTLLLMPDGEFVAHLPEFREVIRQNQSQHHVLTIGRFNNGERPYFYELYCRFDTNAPAGEVLLCAETYAALDAGVRLTPVADYHPLVSGVLSGMDLVDTVFGTLESASLWYSQRSRHLLDKTQRFEGMTNPQEMGFWGSAEGFRYLAEQAATIRAHSTRSRRIVVYDATQVRSFKFLRMVSIFEEIGVEVILVYDEDFAVFASERDIGAINLFARSGHHSLVLVQGREYFSDDPLIALSISDMQSALLTDVPVFGSVAELIGRHYPGIDVAKRDELKLTAASAAVLFEEFSSKSAAQQNVMIESYVERWKTLCSE